ncbi:hypothetical protein MYIN104542_00230 [Mycobacterium intermedium]
MLASVAPPCNKPLRPPFNAATNCGNDAPRLACNAALICVASTGALKLAARFAANVSPVWINALREPPKFVARLLASDAPVCSKPSRPPLNAATNCGNDAPRLACRAALICAATAGMLKLPARLATTVWPVWISALRDPPKFDASVAPVCTKPFTPPLSAATNSGSDAPRLACRAALICAASSGALKLATRLAAKSWPSSMRPPKPPLKADARLAANS